MTIPVFVLGALIGWCGTRGPRPPGPKDPIIGMIGGVVTTALMGWALGFQGSLTSTDLVVISIIAFTGGRVLSDLVNFFRPSESH